MPRILIVDDNAYMRKAMSVLLKNRGHIIDTACNGREAAIKIIRSEEKKSYYDILVTDLMMPDVDGFRLIDLIRKNARPIGIVVITGGGNSLDPNDALKMVEHKVDEKLKKPFRHDEFIMAVEATVKKHWGRMVTAGG
jgi:CheY-like chemotaxis protein